MSFLKVATILSAVASTAYAHGRVTRITANGVNADEGVVDYTNTPAKAIDAGWATKQGDLGFTALSDTTGSIICAKQAVPGISDVAVDAGSVMDIFWDHPGAGERWPASHKGPSLTYLAKCPGTTCAGVDPTSLAFFKIQEEGLVTPGNPGTWSSDKMIAANGSVPVTIPSTLPDGAYVVRHELIALHSAGSADGAQFYPQCINIKVSGGSGSMATDGVPATSLYKATDPGILISIYQQNNAYTIPGPALRTGSGSSSSGSGTGSSSAAASAPAATSSAVVASSSAAPTTLATSVKPTTVSAAAAATSSAAAGSGSGSGSTGKKALPSGLTLAQLETIVTDALNAEYQ